MAGYVVSYALESATEVPATKQHIIVIWIYARLSLYSLKCSNRVSRKTSEVLCLQIVKFT